MKALFEIFWYVLELILNSKFLLFYHEVVSESFFRTGWISYVCFLGHSYNEALCRIEYAFKEGFLFVGEIKGIQSVDSIWIDAEFWKFWRVWNWYYDFIILGEPCLGRGTLFRAGNPNETGFALILGSEFAWGRKMTHWKSALLVEFQTDLKNNLWTF